jgi:hypothetical protein
LVPARLAAAVGAAAVPTVAAVLVPVSALALALARALVVAVALAGSRRHALVSCIEYPLEKKNSCNGHFFFC